MELGLEEPMADVSGGGGSSALGREAGLFAELAAARARFGAMHRHLAEIEAKLDQAKNRVGPDVSGQAATQIAFLEAERERLQGEVRRAWELMGGRMEAAGALDAEAMPSAAASGVTQLSEAELGKGLAFYFERRSILSSVAMADGPEQVYAVLDGGLSTTWRFLDVKTRVSNMLPEICIAQLLLAGLVVYLVYNGRVLAEAFLLLSGLVVGSAFAQGGQVPFLEVRSVIALLFALVLAVVMLMSSYAALVRKPPSKDAKEVLRVTLGMASGALLTLLGVKV